MIENKIMSINNREIKVVISVPEKVDDTIKQNKINRIYDILTKNAEVNKSTYGVAMLKEMNYNKPDNVLSAFHYLGGR